MSDVLNLQSSFFGDFYHLTADSELVFSLFAKLKEDDFIPVKFSVSVGNEDDQSVIFQNRIRFITMDEVWQITVLPNRIDCLYQPPEEEQYSDLTLILDRLCSYTELLRQVLNFDRGQRIAVVARLLLKEMSDREMVDFCKRFGMIFESDFDQLRDWGIRQNVAHEVVLDTDWSEPCNHMIELSKVYHQMYPSRSRIMLYVDINTFPENEDDRFEAKTMAPLGRHASQYISSLLNRLEEKSYD